MSIKEGKRDRYFVLNNGDDWFDCGLKKLTVDV